MANVHCFNIQSDFTGLQDRIFEISCGEMIYTPLGSIPFFEYERCTTNNERVEFVNEILDKYPRELFAERVGKNNATSRKVREMGNVYYKAKDWKSALMQYNMSIAFAEKDSLELAMALGNRASCSIQEGFIADALTDVSRALAIPNIEDGYKAKLTFRKNVCMERIDETQLMPSRGTLPEIKSKGKYFENASSKIEPKKNEKLGNYLVATDDIKTGEVLMIEKPFSSITTPLGDGTHCSFCFFPSRVLMECPHCTTVMYCSQDCLDNHKKVHQFECPIHEYLLGTLGVESNHLLSIRVLIDACLGETPINTPTDEEPVDEINRSSDVRRVFNLRRIKIRQSSLAFKKVALTAAIFVRALRKYTKFFKEFPVTEPEARGFIFNCILILVTNCHDIRGPYDSGEQIGRGVYPALDYLKHSCYPNATGHYFGDVGIIRAFRPIRKGEKIVYDHGFHFMAKGLEDRQLVMINLFGFECTCQACVKNWPVLNDMPVQLPRQFCSDDDTFMKMERKFKELTQQDEQGTQWKKEDLDFLCFYLHYLDDLKIQHPFRAYCVCQILISKALHFFPAYNRC